MRTLTITDPAFMGLGQKTLLAEMLADSPAALWPCADGSGAPADVSGNGRHLTLAAGANTYVADGTHGTVLDMSAGSWTTSYRCPQSAYTLEAWVRLSSNVSGDACPLGDWGGDNAFGAMFHLDGSNGLRGYHRGSSTAASTLSLSAWYHLAFTWDGSTGRLYVDGSQVSTLSNSTAPGTANGAGSASRVSSYGQASTGRRVPGRGRYIAWYAAALSAGRIAAHYAAMV